MRFWLKIINETLFSGKDSATAREFPGGLFFCLRRSAWRGFVIVRPSFVVLDSEGEMP
jgi:hypothetical protein